MVFHAVGDSEHLGTRGFMVRQRSIRSGMHAEFCRLSREMSVPLGNQRMRRNDAGNLKETNHLQVCSGLVVNNSSSALQDFHCALDDSVNTA